MEEMFKKKRRLRLKRKLEDILEKIEFSLFKLVF